MGVDEDEEEEEEEDELIRLSREDMRHDRCE